MSRATKQEENNLANKPSGKHYFREFALAFIWYSRRQAWRIQHLVKEKAQLASCNRTLVEHNYFLMRERERLTDAVAELTEALRKRNVIEDQEG